MSELRLWVHERLARLDGTRERRFVALAAALIFASLSLGPQALRAVENTVNPPDIRIDPLGPDPVPNPVRFRATTLNVMVGELMFVIQMPDGGTMTLPGRTTAADPSRWESEPFQGAPGQAHTVKARGFSPAAGTQVESSQPVTFVILDPNATTGTSAGTGTTADPNAAGTSGGTPATTQKTVELLQVNAWPGVEPKLEARGRVAGFAPASVGFRVRGLTGLAFLGNYPATLAADGTWHALFPVPGGELYRVVMIADDAGALRESLPNDVTVPPPETVAPPPAAATPPPPAPSVAMLAPNAGAELLSPVALAARVMNATATAMIFEVLDPAGVTRTVQGGPVGDGGWTAMFNGEPGQYQVGVRASLIGGAVVPPGDFRSFRIIAPPAAATNTTAAPAPVPATTTPAVQPTIELFSPSAAAEPFPGPVTISARVRDGLPERVVAVVTGPGGETIVVASKTPSGDFWTSIFDGPDGDYRFRVRARVAGADVFSAERGFRVRRPAAALPPPPTTTVATEPVPLPPPPPPPTGTTTTATQPPPLPPPPAPTLTTSATAPRPADAPIAQFDPSIPAALADECRAAGIGPLRCAEWLKARYQSRECLEAGAVTREACEALLARLNIAPDETRLFGLAARQDIVQAREDAAKIAAAPTRREDLPPSIAALLPAHRDPRAFVRLLEVANAGDDSSPALLVLDEDGDGLPDDVERRLGTDPRAPDTDGDGFTDGEEVKNGYNPLGPGALDAPPRGVEKALIEGRPLEEPRGAETLVDPSFTIAADAPAPAEEASEESVIRLSGTAAPNSVVTIFVYSYLPVVVTTTTDENGNWTYDFGSKLAEGRHEAYVSVNDDTGKLVAASSPLAFFVREAQAVTEEDFLRPDVNVEEAPAEMSRWFIYGGIALVVFALVLVGAIIRQVRKSPMGDAGESL